ncbi:XRE family transcriptional regulator [Actinomadura logoneensis]|uniref:XRE family transcriptional regulator n=1 Tax=Actinomadura logoneensis TaxID=2293572 RepID=A0A372JUE6_9ACTN|nr:helix-turn-helix transcriptional regulator [Actinomadura logoneensis]RFU43426.1 XRE family transcriptional regulator [Actinomadura logoneensis]
MELDTDLGTFLKSRRARLTPEDVGLTSYGTRRRVPGLRREELAQLAGVSVQYYTRLEQGQSRNASDGVLAALADALRLDEAERLHLQALNAAGGRPIVRRRTPAERLDPAVRQLLDATPDVAMMVMGRFTDILAWNRLGHAVFGGHLDFGAPTRPADRPNMSRMVFLDPHMRELFVDWEAKTEEAVAHLRMAAGRYPDDPRIASLVGELTVKSPRFAAVWASHEVRECGPSVKELHHPLVGSLTLTQLPLQLPGEPDQRIVAWSAEPGSASEAALRLLGTPVGTVRDVQRQP